MACLSLGWVQMMIIDLIVICAFVATIKLLIPLLVTLLEPIMAGGAAIVGQILTIVLWAIIAIFVVYIVFGLLGCLLGAGGLHMGNFLPRS